jgi:hypothetical protein
VTYRFLCPRHRGWLVNAPERAPAFWSAGMRAAQTLVARGLWHAAIPHVGGAFEAAQLMVGDARLCDRDWLLRHAASRQLLQLVTARLCEQDRPRRTVH